MPTNWENVTKEHILLAIQEFDGSKEPFPNARNTFLLHNNKEYPAKHIRGMAYKIANKKEISKNDYSGGEETVNFFSQRTFKTRYRGKVIVPTLNRESRFTYDDPSQIVVIKKKDTGLTKAQPSIKKSRNTVKGLNVVDQKNALQVLLQKHVGVIHAEKRFPWMKTPDPKNLPPEYKPIAKALAKYRNQSGFLRAPYQLLCDLVIEDKRLIVEYDEHQHFSRARMITLENYPADIKFGYSVPDWISYCDRLNAHDNSPVDRDEKRAFYDTVRDIEAVRNGYTLVRIKHGEFDWGGADADKGLKSLLKIINIKSL